MDALTPLDRAIQEAYASAPASAIALHALEINHRVFDQPARIVRWPITGNKPTEFSCRLEADAPYNPGQLVTFLGVPFDLLLPEKTADQPGTLTITIDGIGNALDEDLRAAALEGGTIECIYREYLKGAEQDGPKSVWFGINIKSPSVKKSALTASGAVLEWVFRPFGTIYTPEEYPGLVRGR